MKLSGFRLGLFELHKVGLDGVALVEVKLGQVFQIQVQIGAVVCSRV